MPDKRAHRGPDPRDGESFGRPTWPALREAVVDLSWLFGRGYTVVSALKLVGDRWSLTERQRQAVRRSACSDEARERRRAHHVAAGSVAGKVLVIDGFNVLTTVEAALGGAVVLICRDTTCRDIAGIHGNYRKVAETLPALEKLVTVLDRLGVRQAVGCLIARSRTVDDSEPRARYGRRPVAGLVRRAGGQPRPTPEQL